MDTKIGVKCVQKKYRDAHVKENALHSKKYRENNREKYNQYHREYWPRRKEWVSQYRREKRKNDINFKLKQSLRNRLWCALKGNFKSGSAIRDLGCTIEELKQHLESQFQSRMSWENYGLKGWHIDHIKSLASFDLTDRKQLLEAVHYTNLQPLWVTENLKKG